VAGPGPGEVDHHHRGATQDAHDQQVLALVVGGDLLSQLFEAVVDLLLGEEDLDEVVADLGGVHGCTLDERFAARPCRWRART